MKVVGTFSNRTEAQIAQGFLENAGIKAHVAIDDEGGLLPALGAQKGAQIYVSDDDAEKARGILEQVNGNADPSEN